MTPRRHLSAAPHQGCSYEPSEILPRSSSSRSLMVARTSSRENVSADRASVSFSEYTRLDNGCGNARLLMTAVYHVLADLANSPRRRQQKSSRDTGNSISLLNVPSCAFEEGRICIL